MVFGLQLRITCTVHVHAHTRVISRSQMHAVTSTSPYSNVGVTDGDVIASRRMLASDHCVLTV